MQLRNDYEKEVFNGEQGIVLNFDEEKGSLTVDFDEYWVEYKADELDELTLSYAVSIHKSQGSEYDTVILLLLPSHGIMLNREIFYTAVTRTKNKIYLISDQKTVQRAISISRPSERKTLLTYRLNELNSGENHS
jgi:exodeoxyribonuclease V alpha subunit